MFLGTLSDENKKSFWPSDRGTLNNISLSKLENDDEESQSDDDKDEYEDELEDEYEDENEQILRRKTWILIFKQFFGVKLFEISYSLSVYSVLAEYQRFKRTYYTTEKILMRKDLKVFHLQQKIEFINEEDSDDEEEDEDSYGSLHQASDYDESDSDDDEEDEDYYEPDSESPYDWRDGCHGDFYVRQRENATNEDDYDDIF